MIASNFIQLIEEQTVVGFTGKLNILKTKSKQMLGYVLFLEGKVINAFYQNHTGIKAFFSLAIDNHANAIDMTMLIEPEIVNLDQQKIHFPVAILKKKMEDILARYELSKEQNEQNI